MWTRALAFADDSCGGKAHGLARLIAAGLRVPDGFVIDDRAFRVATGDAVRLATDEHPGASMSGVALRTATLEPDPGISLVMKSSGPAPDSLGHTMEELARRIERAELPPTLVDEVTQRARELGGPLAVRSSATIEDREAGSAAGVFSSRTAVALDELWPAIRAVWLSALTPLAAAYARRSSGTISINVIVQRSVAGTPAIVYTRPPGQPAGAEAWIQRGDTVTKIARDQLPLGLAVERAIGAERGADIELVGDDLAQAWIVQARPIVHPVIEPLAPPPPAVLAPLQDGRTWTWDVTHNPDPLSPAQQGLVYRIERAGAAPWSSRICAGYLYTSSTGTARVARPVDVAELVARASEIEARMTAVLGTDAVALDHAIERYVAWFRIWANELGPLIASCRGPAPAGTGERTSAVELALLAAATGEIDDATVLGHLGRLAPAWDVAVPTFGERPAVLRDAIARARLAEPAPEQARPWGREMWTRLVAPDRSQTRGLAAVAADLAERDDFWFANAQWLVRHAILNRARLLGIDPDDAFWLPLDELASVETLDPVDANRRASGARAAAERASRWNMPMSVGDPNSSTRESTVALRGFGSGRRVTGRVRRLRSLASAIVVGRGDVVVTRAVTPALAVIVIGCAAIVSETGGPLDHGAAMARELGIACVVGCRDAWIRLADGMIVTIDGDVVTID